MGAFRGSLATIRAQLGELEEARTLFTVGEAQVRGKHAHELAKLQCKRSLVEHGAGAFAAAAAALVEAESIADEMAAGPDSELRRAIERARKLPGT